MDLLISGITFVTNLYGSLLARSEPQFYQSSFVPAAVTEALIMARRDHPLKSEYA